MKQSYELEDMRLLEYGRLRALVAAVAYFAMAWLGLDGPDRGGEPAGKTFQLELGL